MAALDAHELPGLSLVVLQGDSALLMRGYGHAGLAREEAISETTVFQLGSISKQFLAVLVLALAEDGKLSVDDPVTRHLPQFALLSPDVRIRHLLNHTSGLRELFTLPEAQSAFDDLSRSRDELEAAVRRAPVDFDAGSRWSYSNTNYTILALLVERVTGQPYEQALSNRFFKPLGLHSLRQCTPLPLDRTEAQGHEKLKGVVVTAAPENMNWIRGDGGLCGSALDVARWTRLLAAGKVVTPRSYRLMTAPTLLLPGSRQADYGFGLSLVNPDGQRKVAHNGAMRGFSASAAYYPDAALTVVVLANRGDVRTESIERAVARHLLGVKHPPLGERLLAADEYRRFLGTYDIGVFKVRVVDRKGQLWLEMPRPGPTTQLSYLGNCRFAGKADPDAYELTFSGGPEAAQEVRLLMGAMHWYGVRVQ
ncbi:MAG: beta-lactamase family protein [Burkholderiaceae bacterium]|nr:beta-lactamase family protein [Burkholderiaceae bacterium]